MWQGLGDLVYKSPPGLREACAAAIAAKGGSKKGAARDLDISETTFSDWLGGSTKSLKQTTRRVDEAVAAWLAAGAGGGGGGGDGNSTVEVLDSDDDGAV